MQELDLAPFGMTSLETTLALVVTKLIEPGHLDWPTALAKLQQRATAVAVEPPPAVDLTPLTRAMRQYDVTVVESMLTRHATLLPPPRYASTTRGSFWTSSGLRMWSNT